ncbi:MAG: hypothetical protein QN158_13445 [Armatimonadota bacterium]|nr:hypothetical protein [Armatimonadota bacterium]
MEAGAGSERGCELSVVVTARNDDHGGGMLGRVGIFVKGLLALAAKFGLRGELIVVEWNPPQTARLWQVLEIGEVPKDFAVRFLEVPHGIHRRLRNSDVIPLFQMIAKNAGIRRARGRFVLATNPDVLFSAELVEWMASGRWREDRLYRVDRHDVEAGVPGGVGIDEQLEWCRGHVIRVHRRLVSRSVGGTPGRRLVDGWVRILRAALGWRWAGWARAVRAAIPLFSEGWARTAMRAREWARRGFQALARVADPLAAVHTNACGDFTLLARTAWFRLRGYPELEMWSMHVDSLLCYMAVASGMRQEILRWPAAVFHIEHGRSWVTLRPEERLQIFAQRPWLDLWVLQDAARRMLFQRAPVVVNSELWGLGGEELEEVRFGGSGARRLRAAGLKESEVESGGREARG